MRFGPKVLYAAVHTAGSRMEGMHHTNQIVLSSLAHRRKTQLHRGDVSNFDMSFRETTFKHRQWTVRSKKPEELWGCTAWKVIVEGTPLIDDDDHRGKERPRASLPKYKCLNCRTCLPSAFHLASPHIFLHDLFTRRSTQPHNRLHTLTLGMTGPCIWLGNDKTP